MKYLELKQKHMGEWNAFPFIWAFSDKQLKEGMEKMGVTPEELVRIPHGGFIKRTDSNRLATLLIRHDREMKELFKDDRALVEAMEYELANHEYTVTWDAGPALRALGLESSVEDIDERTEACLAVALRRFEQD